MTNYDIITPIAFWAEYINDTIDSALRQTLPYNTFIFVVNNDSIRERELIYSHLQRVPRSIVVCHPKLTAGAARQIGLSLATSEFIAFLDDDDLWYADKLMTQTQLLGRSSNTLISYTSYNAVSYPNNKPLFCVYLSRPSSYKSLYFSNPIANSSVVCRRSLFIDKVVYSSIPVRNDYATWLCLFRDNIKQHHQIVISTVMTTVRKRNKSLSHKSGTASILRAYQSIGHSFLTCLILALIFSLSQVIVKTKRMLSRRP